jgi:hypothetical protein
LISKSLNSLFASICLFLISASLSFNLVPFSFNDATVSGSTVPPSSIILLFLGTSSQKIVDQQFLGRRNEQLIKMMELIEVVDKEKENTQKKLEILHFFMSLDVCLIKISSLFLHFLIFFIYLQHTYICFNMGAQWRADQRSLYKVIKELSEIDENLLDIETNISMLKVYEENEQHILDNP